MSEAVASAAAAEAIQVQEVGPRDGLQNEPVRLSVEERLQLIAALAASGLKRIEVGSFVRPDWIPQMANTDALVRLLPSLGLPANVRLTALVPNRSGLSRAVDAGIREVAVFMSASESHNQKNTNKSIAASLTEFEQLIPEARMQGLFVRGYVSVVWGCPYEGKVDPRRALEIAGRLRDAGCGEISLGDTIGVGNPRQTRDIVKLFAAGQSGTAPFTPGDLALHLHDTHGTALANVIAAWHLGVRIFDASVGGTGGCPYAPGAAGNLATEDLVSMFEDMGVPTGVDLPRLIQAGGLAQRLVARKLPGRRLQAALGRVDKAERKRAGS